jgi:pyridoxine 5-phosphate synthase
VPALLSVNVNKVALLRNSRGGPQPDLSAMVDVCIAGGAQGITVHPRRDQRHVRFDDVPTIAAHLRAHHGAMELNVECEDHPEILGLVRTVRPAQCTLVPVTPGEVTSDHGWPMPASIARLRPVIASLKAEGIRVSCFTDPDPALVPHFAEAGADRIEIYTGPYAHAWGTDGEAEHTRVVWETAAAAVACGLGVNAGHDLDRHNLRGIAGAPGLAEVSIGHAVICRALEVGLAEAVRELRAALTA